MKNFNRWIYAAAGVAVLLLAGMIYAWTVLQAPIAAMFTQWSKGQLSMTFTITMLGFCIGGFIGGKTQSRIAPRKIVLLSAFLFLAGFVIISRANSLAALHIGFGVLSGTAAGLVYNAVISSVSAWFPDKPGLISGILMMGFGMSSFMVGKIFTALTPSDGSDAWRHSFLVFGIILFAIVAVSSIFVVKPHSSWKSPAGGKKKNTVCYEELGPGRMLRKPSFWMYITWTTCLSTSGLAMVSQGTPLALESCPELSMGAVATVVGLISVSNGMGRILFGAMFDRFGRTLTMLSGGILFFAALGTLLLALWSHSFVLLIAAFMGIGVGYSCVPPLNSEFIRQFYGQQNYPANFSIINMNLLVSSFGPAIAGTVYDLTNSYVMLIIFFMTLIAAAAVLGCFIRPPKGTAQ